MCIVVDSNTLSCVFDTSNSDHDSFKPVADWITNGNGKLIFGGTKYIRELKKMPKYVRFIIELKKSNNAIEFDCDSIDHEERQVSRIHGKGSKDFNDKHIVAIFRATKCNLLCSNDKKSDKFIKNLVYYASPLDRPSIYRDPNHAHLLCEANIAPCCR